MVDIVHTHGGCRPGAGRKRKAPRPRLPHRARPRHDARHPVHVTLRRRAGLPSFRQQRVGALLLGLIRRLNDAGFQIVHFSIQSNHVHLIVEASDRETLRRKASGFAISFARRLNQDLLGGRRGKVWEDRHFRRDIEGAREMHAVLRYVLGNAKKHGVIPADAVELDPYSSAWTFRGWDVAFERPPGVDHWPRPEPRTQLLREDWLAWGLVPVLGAPGPRSGR